jgi:hypothetical protein
VGGGAVGVMAGLRGTRIYFFQSFYADNLKYFLGCAENYVLKNIILIIYS